jgi:hypothetical protein
MNPANAFLADAIVSVHFLFVAFCVVGEAAILLGALLRWRWIRNFPFRIAHACAVLFVAAEALLGATCPLTDWEYRLRSSAGQRYDADMSFVARIIRRIIFYDFPPAFFTALYLGFGALVLLTLIFIRPRLKNRPRKPRV